MYEMSLEEKLDPAYSALLLFNPQNDFLTYSNLAIQEQWDLASAKAMLGTWHNLLQAARKAGTHVIFVRTVHGDTHGTYLSEGSAEVVMRRLSLSSLNGWGCLEGSEGSRFYSGFEPNPSEYVLTKQRYNAFWDTPLERQLKKQGVRTVIASGVASNLCVESSIRTAFLRDFHICPIHDCCAAYENGRHEATMRNMEGLFGQVCSYQDVRNAWGIS